MQIVGITSYISVEAELLEAKEWNKRSSQNETSKEAKTSHKEAVPRPSAEALLRYRSPGQEMSENKTSAALPLRYSIVPKQVARARAGCAEVPCRSLASISEQIAKKETFFTRLREKKRKCRGKMHRHRRIKEKGENDKKNTKMSRRHVEALPRYRSKF